MNITSLHWDQVRISRPHPQKNASQNAENEAVTISHGYHLPSEHQKSVKDKQTPAAGAAEQVVSGHYNASHYITAFHIGM